jgi:hypothetical protein
MTKKYSIKQKIALLFGCLYQRFRHLQHILLLNAHLNQHYNKDEDGKLGHGSAVGWYDNVRQL